MAWLKRLNCKEQLRVLHLDTLSRENARSKGSDFRGSR